jgi:hypothetical protein
MPEKWLFVAFYADEFGFWTIFRNPVSPGFAYSWSIGVAT